MMIFLLKFVFILVEQSVQNFLCQLFYQWIHSLAEHTTSGSKYSVLHFAHKPSVLLRICFQSFSLRYTLKNALKNTFSTCIQLHFSASFILFYFQFLFLRVHERQIIFLPYMDICKPFCGGCFAKVFYPLTIIGKLRAVCWGISRKFYKKIAENFSRQPHIKRKSDIIQTSFSVFIKLFFIVLKALLRSLPFFCRLTTVS